MPNFNDSFIIEADASSDGISAVLSQQGKPIAFMSRALRISKQLWSVYAKEMLAIVEAIRIWRPNLLGRKFIIWTDQKSLKYLLEQQITTFDQQWWVAKLLGYDYEIQYCPGQENTAADSLSRKPASPILNSLFVSQVHIWEEIKEATGSDEYTIQLSRACCDVAIAQINYPSLKHNTQDSIEQARGRSHEEGSSQIFMLDDMQFRGGLDVI